MIEVVDHFIVLLRGGRKPTVVGGKLPGSVKGKCQWVVPGHPHLSLRRQCEFLGLGRANWCYHPAEESAETLELMGHDRQYTQAPFYGVVG